MIALRKRSGTISGSVLLNGWPQDKLSFTRSSGYVEQFDVQSPELTVHETVLFSARLRLDSMQFASDEETQAFVDQIMVGGDWTLLLFHHKLTTHNQSMCFALVCSLK